MTNIPASAIVSVVPQVMSGGGNGLELNLLLLTDSARLPIGDVYGLASADAVSAYFGATSTEAALAAVYFLGFDNSNIKPGRLLFSRYPTAAVASWLRGGSVASMALTDLQALSGVLTISVNGVAKTSSTINLSSATSFSGAAAIIAAAFTSPGFAVTFDSLSGGFLFTNASTGASSTITVASGTLAAPLKLTTETAAVTSQGADAATPAGHMTGVVSKTTNWATFTTAFDPDAGSGNAVRLAFSAWNNSRGNRFGYIAADYDASPTASSSASACLAAKVLAADYSGTCLIWAPTWAKACEKAVFIGSCAASVDWTQSRGKIALAYKHQTGLAADVVDLTTATNLEANGYNYYGIWSTANDDFRGVAPGSITGPFDFFGPFISQIWLNNALQLANMVLLFAVRYIPYNSYGYSLIRQAAADVIQQALRNGVITAGVTLSNLQKAQVNGAAGFDVATIIEKQGWYYLVEDATAQVRAAGGSPPCTLWYTDGGSVRKLNIASVEIQ